MRRLTLVLSSLFYAASMFFTLAAAADDPYLWLEAPKSERALEWAKAQSDRAKAELSSKPEYSAISDELRSTLSAAPPSPSYALLNEMLLRVSRDVAHPYGLIEVADRGPEGAPGPWRVALDMEKLRQEEGKPYELLTFDFESACLPPVFDRCILSLSLGGSQDVELREFDLKTGAFVSDGFRLGVGRSPFAWLDQNHLLIASTALGDPITRAHGSNAVHLWTRGQAPSAAPVIWRGEPTDQFILVSAVGDGSSRQGVISEVVNYSKFKFFLVGAKGRVRAVNLHLRVRPFWPQLRNTASHLIFQTSEAGAVGGVRVAPDTVIAYDVNSPRPADSPWSVVYSPKGEDSIVNLAATRSTVDFVLSNHLKERPVSAHFDNGAWRVHTGAELPGGISVGFPGADPESDDLLLKTAGFITPERLELLRPGAPAQLLYAQAPIFDASNYMVEIRSTKSRDGTRVDYYLLRPRHPPHPGSTPTLMTGYGAFDYVVRPNYFGFDTDGGAELDLGGSSLKIWLSRGGALALPIIRGGGERGDEWHRVAMGAHRQLSYDDFLAATEDLEKDFTTPAHLGVFGTSNGGLLAAVVAIERPDLYSAVVCDATTSDLLRLQYMGMGAAWLDEYGDPKDPGVRAAILRYSPYQNVRDGTKYPPFLITGSTQDNTVGPGHGRKLAARLEAAGVKVYFYEDQEGGHKVSDPLARPDMLALRMTFLVDALMDRGCDAIAGGPRIRPGHRRSEDRRCPGRSYSSGSRSAP